MSGHLRSQDPASSSLAVAPESEPRPSDALSMRDALHSVVQAYAYPEKPTEPAGVTDPERPQPTTMTLQEYERRNTEAWKGLLKSCKIKSRFVTHEVARESPLTKQFEDPSFADPRFAEDPRHHFARSAITGAGVVALQERIQFDALHWIARHQPRGPDGDIARIYIRAHRHAMREYYKTFGRRIRQPVSLALNLNSLPDTLLEGWGRDIDERMAVWQKTLNESRQTEAKACSPQSDAHFGALNRSIRYALIAAPEGSELSKLAQTKFFAMESALEAEAKKDQAHTIAERATIPTIRVPRGLPALPFLRSMDVGFAILSSKPTFPAPYV